MQAINLSNVQYRAQMMLTRLMTCCMRFATGWSLKSAVM
jgi:hypothetical protein